MTVIAIIESESQKSKGENLGPPMFAVFPAVLASAELKSMTSTDA